MCDGVACAVQLTRHFVGETRCECDVTGPRRRPGQFRQHPGPDLRIGLQPGEGFGLGLGPRTRQGVHEGKQEPLPVVVMLNGDRHFGCARNQRPARGVVGGLGAGRQR